MIDNWKVETTPSENERDLGRSRSYRSPPHAGRSVDRGHRVASLHLLGARGGARVNEESREHAASQTLTQRQDLCGLVDAEDLDLYPACGVLRQVVQRGAGGAVAHCAHDVPAFLDELGDHGVT